MIVVTSNEISQKNILEYHGIAKGVVVRQPTIKQGFKGAFTLGGKNDAYTEACEQTRQQAYDMMVEDAKKLGANAVIGMRFDASEFMQDSTEVIAYGTAITIE
ncbi:YbjQ family protein [Shewanella youngdeokensis]|uniref:UPF0145 protein RGE70_00660 n=1 Tax=Shewanella youngdeokensis TaxID=2999068 RepID=A0ABZ0JYX6_9GAMM|nr:YbjQ family protein [Shewanella sp. DAU334]